MSDVDVTGNGNGVAARLSAGIPQARWIRPLDTFLGDEEPSDDDSEDWCIRDIIPRGEPWIWGGPSKRGKTWSALDLSICVALGTPWLGSFANTWGAPKRVLAIALEDGQRRLRKRLWELCRGHDVSPNDTRLRSHMVVSREAFRIPDAKDEKMFAAELKAWKPEVVIVDNLSRVMVGDQNAIKDMARFTSSWTRMCSDTGASIGFLHHTNKSSDPKRDPFDLLRGSGDLLAATRNAIVSLPMEINGKKASELHIRGNLDLRRDNLAVSFEREMWSGKWVTKLVDRGDVKAWRGNERAKKADESAKERAELFTERKKRAIELARNSANLMVTSRALAEVLGVRSSNTALAVLQQLAAEGTMEVVTGKDGGFRLRPGVN